ARRRPWAVVLFGGARGRAGRCSCRGQALRSCRTGALKRLASLLQHDRIGDRLALAGWRSRSWRQGGRPAPTTPTPAQPAECVADRVELPSELLVVRSQSGDLPLEALVLSYQPGDLVDDRVGGCPRAPPSAGRRGIGPIAA